jgi:GTP-binding protein HflX
MPELPDQRPGAAAPPDDHQLDDTASPIHPAPPDDHQLDDTDGEQTHRGAFGAFAGEGRGLIDRSFRERIVLVGVTQGRQTEAETDESLDELERLVDTAGADAVARLAQKRAAPDPATFVGKGKADEIREVSVGLDADTVVFDDELSPAQQFNLERILGRTALDRTAVILDIFAQNAASPEGRAQVELAQIRYRLPRLRGAGKRLSQQAAGIGTRGPGETQLEVDRRRLVRRMHKLEEQLRDVGRHRANQSKRRRESAHQSVAIVGYTNAGKSTLLNRLTDAGVLAADRLFATLDAKTRRLKLPGGEVVFLTDTVGFVRKLPHQLVDAFKTTLDVVIDADLLLHVVDATAADPQAQMDAVHEVLREIGADHVPQLVVFNKLDAVDEATARHLLADHPGAVGVAAATGEGIDRLLDTIGDRLRSLASVVELLVPYERGDVLAQLHREGQVLSEMATDTGMRVRARLDRFGSGRLAEWLVEPAAARLEMSDGL